MKVEKALLSTLLSRWYISHGLVITKVHQVIEYTPVRVFKTFVKTVTDARRKHKKTALGDMMDFFSRGETMAHFIESGTDPLLRDKFIMWTIAGNMSSNDFFKSHVGIGSKLQLLHFDNACTIIT